MNVGPVKVGYERRSCIIATVVISHKCLFFCSCRLWLKHCICFYVFSHSCVLMFLSPFLTSLSLSQMFLVALSFAYFAKALSGSYMKSTITQLERRFDIPSYLIGVIDGSFEVGEYARQSLLSSLLFCSTALFHGLPSFLSFCLWEGNMNGSPRYSSCR